MFKACLVWLWLYVGVSLALTAWFFVYYPEAPPGSTPLVPPSPFRIAGAAGAGFATGMPAFLELAGLIGVRMRLRERTLQDGDEVVVFGMYSAARRAIVPDPTNEVVHRARVRKGGVATVTPPSRLGGLRERAGWGALPRRRRRVGVLHARAARADLSVTPAHPVHDARLAGDNDRVSWTLRSGR